MILLLTEGQVSDYRGAATVLPDLPDADVLIADKGYDSDWFREALTDLEIDALHPGPGEPQGADPLRRRPLQAAQPHRAHVRQAQGLATHRHPIRPLRPHLHERHLHRRNRHLLVMSPEPSDRPQHQPAGAQYIEERRGRYTSLHRSQRMAVYAYVRVSTKAQVEGGESLGVQERMIRGYAMMHGFPIVETLVEKAVSGGKPFADRPEAGRALRTLKRGDVLI